MMKKLGGNKLYHKLGIARNHHAVNIQTDQPVSVHSPNGGDKVQTSTTHTPTSMAYVIEELQKMSILVPPNRTVVESDYIPFPPDWKGPIPACQQHLYKKPNLFRRTMSFLKRKRSFSSSSGSSHKSKPLLTAVNSVQRSNQQYVLPRNKTMGTTPVILPSEGAIIPSTYDRSWSEGNNKTLFDSELLEIDE